MWHCCWSINDCSESDPVNTGMDLWVGWNAVSMHSATKRPWLHISMLVSCSSSLSQHSLVGGPPAGKQTAAASGKTEDSETVVILADADLLELPLEAVASLRADVIDSVSRDISLQLLYHRLATMPPGECRPQQCRFGDRKSGRLSWFFISQFYNVRNILCCIILYCKGISSLGNLCHLGVFQRLFQNRWRKSMENLANPNIWKTSVEME